MVPRACFHPVHIKLGFFFEGDLQLVELDKEDAHIVKLQT